MSLHAWLAFVGASIILLLIPGPTILLVIGDTLANRGRSAWSTIAGVAAGDTTSMSISLAGAGALLKAEDAPAEALRRNVTSPHGTTEAALTILMAKDGMAPLIKRAVSAARKRARELSN